MNFQAILREPIQAHGAIQSAWRHAKPHVMAGNVLVLRVEPFEERLSDRQRRYYHGYVLSEIARQAKPAGQTFPLQVWKEWYRNKFLGSRRKVCIDPLTGRKSRRCVRVSSEDLGVRGYAKLIEQVTAHAASELGVVFTVGMDEWVDMQTGEIIERRAA